MTKKHDEEEVAQFCAILGPRLKSARETLSITQRQAGDRTGISEEFYGRIERGQAMPSVLTMKNLSDGLNVPIEQLYRGGSASEDAILAAALVNLVENNPKLKEALFARVKCPRCDAEHVLSDEPDENPDEPDENPDEPDDEPDENPNEPDENPP